MYLRNFEVLKLLGELGFRVLSSWLPRFVIFLVMFPAGAFFQGMKPSEVAHLSEFTFTTTV